MTKKLEPLKTNTDTYVVAEGPLGLTGPFRKRLKWNGKYQTLEKNCSDCKHLIGYQSWWCTNKDAVELHDTAIPRYSSCEFWEPCAQDEPPYHVKISNLLKKKLSKI